MKAAGRFGSTLRMSRGKGTKGIDYRGIATRSSRACTCQDNRVDGMKLCGFPDNNNFEVIMIIIVSEYGVLT
jgi:hypothetical protein